jgi:hypothetical protein
VAARNIDLDVGTYFRFREGFFFLKVDLLIGAQWCCYVARRPWFIPFPSSSEVDEDCARVVRHNFRDTRICELGDIKSISDNTMEQTSVPPFIFGEVYFKQQGVVDA